MSAVKSRAQCSPRKTVVKLPIPGDEKISKVMPTEVIVNRCKGSCHNPHHSCFPTNITSLSIPVLLSYCGNDKTTGICEKKCSQVEVVKHNACSCGCEKTKNSCRYDQKFNNETCQCECLKDISWKCFQEMKQWDPHYCSCRCHLHHFSPCAPNYAYDFHGECKCLYVAKVDDTQNLAIITLGISVVVLIFALWIYACIEGGTSSSNNARGEQQAVQLTSIIHPRTEADGEALAEQNNEFGMIGSEANRENYIMLRQDDTTVT